MLYCDYWQCCESGSCVSSCKLCNRRTSSLPPPAVSLGMLGLFCSSCNPTEKRTRRTSPRLVRRCFSRTSSHLVTSLTVSPPLSTHRILPSPPHLQQWRPAGGISAAVSAMVHWHPPSAGSQSPSAPSNATLAGVAVPDTMALTGEVV
jgi:hypothetical protein